MSVSVSPWGPKPQLMLATGLPNVGGQLFFYVAGSVSTKQDTFTDHTGNSTNTNPVVLNALGMPPNELWLTDGLYYKVVYAPAGDTDPPSSPIWTVDYVTGVVSSVPTIEEWVSTTLTPNYISATQFTLLGDQTATFQLGRRLKTTITAGTGYHTIRAVNYGGGITTVTTNGTALDSGLSAVWYGVLSANNQSSIPEPQLSVVLNVKAKGAVGDGVTDDSQPIQDAIDTGLPLYFPPGTYLVGTKLQFNQDNASYFGGSQATILFNGIATTRLVDFSGDNCVFDGLSFDANAKQVYFSMFWIADNTQHPVFSNCWFGNVSGTHVGGLTPTPANMQSAVCCSLYNVAGLRFDRCRFYDVLNQNNGVGVPLTNGYGFATGLLFHTEDGSEPNVPQINGPTWGTVSDCEFYNVRTVLPPGLSINDQHTYDDSDGIRTYGIFGLPFTSGGVTEIVATNTITGATSGATAVVSSVQLTSGSWAGGDAAGYLIVTSQSAPFVAENLNVGASTNLATIAGNTGPITELPVLIQACHFDRCQKRAIKMSVAKNTQFKDCDVYGTNLTYPMLEVAKNDSEGSVIEGLRFFGSADKPVNIAIVNHDASYTVIRDTRITHCTTFYSQQSKGLLSAMAGGVFSGIYVENLYDKMFRQEADKPTTITNMRYEDITALGASNSVSGFNPLIAQDNTTGATIRNLVVKNADVFINGLDNDVDGLNIEVTNGGFTGSTTTRPLLDYGISVGTTSIKNVIRNVIVRMAVNPTTPYFGTRTRLVWFRGDKMKLSNIEVYADPALATATYPHIEIGGSDNMVDSVRLDSYGILQVGNASGTHARNSLSRLVRVPNSTSAESFVYLVKVSGGTWVSDVYDNNALSGDYAVLSDGTSAGFIWLSNLRARSYTAPVMNITGGSLILDGYRSGFSTYNPANIPAGTQISTTVTITGAALADPILNLSFSLDLANVELTGYMSAADTATVLFKNGDTVDHDLANGTIRASARQRQVA